MDAIVTLPDEVDGLDILASAISIRDPLSFLAREIQIKHGGHRVYSKSIYMVLVQPENGVIYQELPDLGSAEVED